MLVWLHVIDLPIEMKQCGRCSLKRSEGVVTHLRESLL